MSTPNSPTVTIDARLKAQQTPNDYEFFKQMNPKAGILCSNIDERVGEGFGHKMAMYIHYKKKELSSSVQQTLNFD